MFRFLFNTDENLATMRTKLPIPYPFFCLTTILLLLCNIAMSQGSSRVDIGKSYANLNKLSGGGTFNPGDTIEIRVTIAVITQAGTATTVDKVQVFDTVPGNTTYIPGSLRLATNEGITYKTFTDASGDDAGSISSGNIMMNLGSNATPLAGGKITSNTSRPSFFNSHCITMACYRVKINTTVGYGDSILIGGKAVYKMTAPTVLSASVVFPVYKLLVFSNSGYCSNGLDVAVNSDSSGTFGSGTTTNRSSALAYGTTYTKQLLSTGQPQDYFYAIVQNSSPDSSTNVNSTMPEATALHRVFGYWDICGDHTGAASPSLGNPPAAPNSRGGYMVLVNASYNTDIAYQETLNNLCPNTYYEFSAWFRNLCPRCSCDSTGKASGSAGYIPGPGNDSSGVHPNLNFEIDGLAYYSSGDMKYDRVTPWKKFGFTFLTRANQTSAQFVIRNNSPGGGGNDWALDDIKVSHCGPSLKMDYAPIITFCKGYNYPLLLADTIRYLYNDNYVQFKWQQSNIGGTIWTDMTGPGTSGTGSPTMVNGQWQYVTSLPWFYVTGADSGRYYRVIVATSLTNLSNSSCAYTDGSAVMIKAITCSSILTTGLTQFNGRAMGLDAFVTWQASEEDNVSHYEIERSTDGVNFIKVCVKAARNRAGAYYTFDDPGILTTHIYYRLKIAGSDGNYKYSNTIMLTTGTDFEVKNLLNPFNDILSADVTVPVDGMVGVILYNDKGQLIRSEKVPVKKGSNGVTLSKMDNMSKGIYILSIEFNNEVTRRRIIKL